MKQKAKTVLDILLDGDGFTFTPTLPEKIFPFHNRKQSALGIALFLVTFVLYFFRMNAVIQTFRVWELTKVLTVGFFVSALVFPVKKQPHHDKSPIFTE